MNGASSMTVRKFGFGSWLRPLLIVLIFAAAGPFFGFLSLVTTAVIRTALIEPVSLAGLPPLAKLVGALGLAYGFSVLFGGVQALFVGIVAARSYVRSGRVSLKAVLGAAALTYAAFLLFMMSKAGQHLMGSSVWFMALPHFAAAFCCWLLVSRWRERGAI